MINKVFILGNLTADPDLRYTPGGAAFGGFSVAINSQRKGNDGEMIQEVDYIAVTTWGKTAENCAEYLHKGSKVIVQGKLKQDRWVDEATGKNREKVKVFAELVQFLDAKPSTDKQSRPAGGGRGSTF